MFTEPEAAFTKLSAVSLSEYGLEDQDKYNTADTHDQQYFRGDLIDGVHKARVIYLYFDSELKFNIISLISWYRIQSGADFLAIYVACVCITHPYGKLGGNG